MQSNIRPFYWPEKGSFFADGDLTNIEWQPCLIWGIEVTWQGLDQSDIFRQWRMCCANEHNIVGPRFDDRETIEMLALVGSEVWPVSNFQQHTTWCANARNMLGPTMLRAFARALRMYQVLLFKFGRHLCKGLRWCCPTCWLGLIKFLVISRQTVRIENCL